MLAYTSNYLSIDECRCVYYDSSARRRRRGTALFEHTPALRFDILCKSTLRLHLHHPSPPTCRPPSHVDDVDVGNVHDILKVRVCARKVDGSSPVVRNEPHPIRMFRAATESWSRRKICTSLEYTASCWPSGKQIQKKNVNAKQLCHPRVLTICMCVSVGEHMKSAVMPHYLDEQYGLVGHNFAVN